DLQVAASKRPPRATKRLFFRLLLSFGRFAFSSFCLGLHGRRAGDGGDCEVTIGDDGPDALGQRHRGNVDGIADFPACQINGDGVRDRIGRAIELDFVAHDVEHPTALDAGRLVLVDEADRDVDVNFRILAHPQEVHVQREILDRIELVVLRQYQDHRSVHVDRGNRCNKAVPLNLYVDDLVGQHDGYRRLLVAVDVDSYLAMTATCTGPPLTAMFASLGLELISFVADGV